MTEHPINTWLLGDQSNLIDHAELMARMARKQVVCLGETHDRADIHRWQLNVAAGVLAHRKNIVMGFEMFPRRVQPALDVWTSGGSSEEAFLEAVEWKTVWGFSPDLYLPLFRFCREAAVRMLALNCRRELVTEIRKHGWAAIPEEDRDGLTPSREAPPEYRNQLHALISDISPKRKTSGAEDPQVKGFVRAQQVWDRAFACNIARALDVQDPPLVIGIIGRGHLEFGWGTPYQLHDLGVTDVGVLLPADGALFRTDSAIDIADAIYRLPAPASCRDQQMRARGRTNRAIQSKESQ